MEWMPKLGQGTWRMGEHRASWEAERAALVEGMEAGITLIDTAEMYGEGRAETLVGEAIRHVRRDTLTIVSKVYPHNAGGKRLATHCEASLQRMGIEALDLYLLHWRGSIPLAETVEGMEALVRAGKIRRWGVSNFDTEDMMELFAVPNGARCATNQVLYHLGSRGIEYSLLPWMRAHGLRTMAYCPLAQAGRLRSSLLQSEAVRTVAQKHGITPMQALLGFVLAQPDVTAIPKAANTVHVRQNASMAHHPLDAEDIALLGRAFPAPDHRVPLDIE